MMTHNTDDFNLDAKLGKLESSIDQLILERDQWKAKAEYWEGEFRQIESRIEALVGTIHPVKEPHPSEFTTQSSFGSALNDYRMWHDSGLERAYDYLNLVLEGLTCNSSSS